MKRAPLALAIATWLSMGSAGRISGAPHHADMQAPSEVHAIELATAAWLRGQHAGQRVGLDEARIAFGRGVAGSLEARPILELLALADTLRSQVLDPTRSRVCRPGQNDSCIAIVLRIGTPAVTGDTARIWVYAWDARQEEERDRHLELARAPGTGIWRVTRVREIRRAG